jgi:hypothetical protein
MPPVAEYAGLVVTPGAAGCELDIPVDDTAPPVTAPAGPPVADVSSDNIDSNIS